MYIENQPVDLPILREKKISLHVKREDLIHPLISGNKFRKLKYNLEEAQKKGCQTLITFGGAFSNHIAATAYACNQVGMAAIGIIRGEELALQWQQNPTLLLAHQHGMRFKFVSRAMYREKKSTEFELQLRNEFGDFYALPEGGTNVLAIKGCEEMITQKDLTYDIVCTAVGTGGTLVGISNAISHSQSVLGFAALKGDFLKEDIRNFAPKGKWELQTDYHFGGYAKVSETLVTFINDFKEQTKIPLDPIYTGKLVFGILDLIQKDYFKPNTKILAIHTGGLQGITGMNTRLKKKNLPLIRQ